MKSTSMERFPLDPWSEPLPEQCPPDQAFRPDSMVVYRCCDCPPTETNFQSLRCLYPKKIFNVDECRARSLTVWDDLDVCKRVLMFPAHRSQRIAQFTLNDCDGVILKSGQAHHFSWWKTNAFGLNSVVIIS